MVQSAEAGAANISLLPIHIPEGYVVLGTRYYARKEEGKPVRPI